MSDSLPLDRVQPDVRSVACKALHPTYPKDLPTASVVIVFHNEILTALLRSIHSVLNHTPRHLLKEIVLIDDASAPDPDRFVQGRWQDLQAELEAHISVLPKVALARMGTRRGLMLARMEGAWRCTGDVIVFLDSHIEATEGWIEPLLARISQDRTHVVVPSIDSIDHDNFDYLGHSGLGVLGFSWTLGQKPQGVKDPWSPEILKSPIMAGGLFASDRSFFMHLGGYDPGMRLYGGEEMEIGFRTWQCGGDIEFVPCSHVFHIFREANFWHGTNSGGVAYKVPSADITRNKLRAAAVWMDDYAKLVEYASPPLPPGMTLGDLEPRRRLREKLQCKPFSWYLQHVAPIMFVPEANGLRAGSLASKPLKACVDTLGGTAPGLYPCHGQHGTQGLVIDGKGNVRVPLLMYEDCLAEDGGRVSLVSCWQANLEMHWTWEPHSGKFISGRGSCLEASRDPTPKSPHSLKIAPCKNGEELQLWEWKDW